jgi:hypothetical protein
VTSASAAASGFAVRDAAARDLTGLTGRTVLITLIVASRSNARSSVY